MFKLAFFETVNIDKAAKAGSEFFKRKIFSGYR